MKNLVLTAIVSGLIAFIVVKLADHAPVSQASTQAQSAFERVTSSRTLRCAYASYDPFLIVENGNIRGIFHDVLEEAGKRLNIKIVWSEEVGYGNINTGFMTNRYDAFCAGLWPAASRAPSTIFSRAIVWDPVSVWTRGKETRFDGHVEMLNDPAYKITDTEGDATASMADVLFPKAGRATVTQNQTIGDELALVISGKAEATFRDYLTMDRYMKDSPGSFKDLLPGNPPFIYGLTIGYNQHEVALKDMVDVVLYDMERDGTTAHIVKSYLGDKAKLLYQKKEQFQPY